MITGKRESEDSKKKRRRKCDIYCATFFNYAFKDGMGLNFLSHRHTAVVGLYSVAIGRKCVECFKTKILMCCVRAYGKQTIPGST